MSGNGRTTHDGFLGGRLVIEQPSRGFRGASDAVLLAAAIEAEPGQCILELGCGAGTAALCLAARVGGLDLHGLELQPAYAALARSNAVANKLALTVHDGDVGDLPPALRILSFDQVFANPPFFSASSHQAPAASDRDIARRASGPTLAVWIECGLRRLRPRGVLTLIQRTDRLPDMLAALAPKAGEITVYPLASRPDRGANRILVRARKGSRAAFQLLQPLVLHKPPLFKEFSTTAERVLRDGLGLSWKID